MAAALHLTHDPPTRAVYAATADRDVWRKGLISPREPVVEEHDVEHDDDRGDEGRRDRRRPAVDETAHEVGPARDEDERHEGEWDAERQDDLGDHERLGRREAECEH